MTSMVVSLGPAYTERERQLCNDASDSALIEDHGQGWEAWPHAHLNEKLKSINICSTSHD